MLTKLIIFSLFVQRATKREYYCLLKMSQKVQLTMSKLKNLLRKVLHLFWQVFVSAASSCFFNFTTMLNVLYNKPQKWNKSKKNFETEVVLAVLLQLFSNGTQNRKCFRNFNTYFVLLNAYHRNNVLMRLNRNVLLVIRSQFRWKFTLETEY